MDAGSTGMEWYTGAINPDGKLAKMTTTIYDAITHKPTKVEMRLSISRKAIMSRSCGRRIRAGR